MPEKVYDPWNLSHLRFSSECCEGGKARVILYDHTGAVRLQCGSCGKQYWRNEEYKI